MIINRLTTEATGEVRMAEPLVRDLHKSKNPVKDIQETLMRQNRAIESLTTEMIQIANLLENMSPVVGKVTTRVARLEDSLRKQHLKV